MTDKSDKHHCCTVIGKSRICNVIYYQLRPLVLGSYFETVVCQATAVLIYNSSSAKRKYTEAI